VADVHGSPQALDWVRRTAPRYDAVIVGGDLAKGGTEGFVKEFLEGAGAGGMKVFFVHGNWDPPDVEVPGGIISLHGRTRMIGKYSIGGLGGSGPTPGRGPFEMDDAGARSVLDKLGHVDVLVSHSPPLRTKCDRAKTGHIGSLPVREYVEREVPAIVLSGHVHEGRAVAHLGGSTIVNPGALLAGNFAEVILDGIISVELKADGGWT